MPNIHFRLACDAYNDAIAAGYLSDNPSAENYAGHYMYMHSDSARDHFKHRNTRQYLIVQASYYDNIGNYDPQDGMTND